MNGLFNLYNKQIRETRCLKKIDNKGDKGEERKKLN